MEEDLPQEENENVFLQVKLTTPFAAFLQVYPIDQLCEVLADSQVQIETTCRHLQTLIRPFKSYVSPDT